MTVKAIVKFLMKRSLPQWMSQTSKTIELSTLTLPKACKLVYSHHAGDCSILCSQISNSHPCPPVIGFDMEWTPSRRKNHENKTAVIQICTPPDMDCYVFHISKLGNVPLILRNIIENRNIIKTGIGVGKDLWKLHRDFDIDYKATQYSFVDLNDFAKSLSIVNDKNWSLQGLTAEVLNRSLKKDKDLQLSDWEKFPLTEKQLEYAALDAYVSLLIYEQLQRKKFALK